MDSHTSLSPAASPDPFPPRPATPRHPTVALLGNPNTGKTTLFNALSGMRQRVGNYPGVTVEIKTGRMAHAGRTLDLIDLPGTYSLSPRSPDEMLAVDVVLGRQPGEPRPDAIVSIVDASNLERNLYLTTQALEVGVPVVVALNMTDVAARQGITVDADRLAKQLGVPVVPIQANKAKGLDRLRRAAAEAAEGGAPPAGPAFPDVFEGEVARLGARLPAVPRFLLRRLLLDAGGYAEARWTGRDQDLAAELRAARARLAASGCKVPDVEARTRYAWIRRATVGCVARPAERPVSGTDRLDRVLTHRVWGTLIFLLVMLVVFQSIFTWARPLMDLIDLGRKGLGDTVRGAMAPGPLRSLLADGVVEGVGSVLMFLPQILILFGFIAVLEDCGYMARAAFLMDRLMARCGLSGKSFIPMLSSAACAVPGILATRVIEDRRDRLTTILVAPLMSCSARLPVYTLLVGAFLTAGRPWWLPGVVMFGLYALGVVLAPLVAFALKRTLLRGEAAVFLLEMPLYKWPSPGGVLRRMADAAGAFLRRAGTLILASMILVWALLYFPSTNAAGESFERLVAEGEEQVEAARGELERQKGEDADGSRTAACEAALAAAQDEVHRLQAEWTSASFLGRAGRRLEPLFTPLGWDWRVGVAALASFPAREVIVGTLGLIYQTGKVDPDEIRQEPGATRLAAALRQATWDGDPTRKVFTVPTALSLLVFFALCCQCASTLAVIRRETGTWRWPLFTFTYMTVLAYVGALLVYQIGSRLA
jgi:ferrous iron transport protein B